ncbi:MAG: hypothetical protein M1831_005139 [Alyxoria varia]|nr:MAG: hypothetical protein M1831_005139 [Alyxoria varia]
MVIPASEGKPAELFLPAPGHIDRSEVFRWHISTRNFFAWIAGVPLVGNHLGQALADLLQRMFRWRDTSADCVEDLLIYADQMGYSTVENCPDYALSMLFFSELWRLDNVYVDAFAHCVGMNDLLTHSDEYDPLSEVSKALITRGHLEMDIHIHHATNALTNLLEEELSPAYLGLSTEARNHLDDFRSFLYSYLIAKQGYWPPSASQYFSMDLCQSLHADFRKLYEFLADKNSCHNSQPFRGVTGGICVLQNIRSFDVRYKHDPLPFAIPLLPDSHDISSQSQKGLRSFIPGTKDGKADRVDRARQSLRAATNQQAEVFAHPLLIQHFIAFEDECAGRPDSKLSMADARKVRWILIYGIVQKLASIVHTPPEVRSSSDITYPMCVLTTGLPPWREISMSCASSVYSDTMKESSLQADIDPSQRSSSPTMSIHPDCEIDDYFGCLPNHSSSDQLPEVFKEDNKKREIPRSSLKDPVKFIKRSSLRFKRNSLGPIRSVTTSDLTDEGYDTSCLAKDMSTAQSPSQPLNGSSTKSESSALHSSGNRISSPHDLPPLQTADAQDTPLDRNDSSKSLVERSTTSSVPSLTFSHGSRESFEWRESNSPTPHSSHPSSNMQDTTIGRHQTYSDDVDDRIGPQKALQLLTLQENEVKPRFEQRPKRTGPKSRIWIED